MSAESVCEAASARGVREDVEYAVTGRPVYADQVSSNAMDMSLSSHPLSSRLSLLRCTLELVTTAIWLMVCVPCVPFILFSYFVDG